MTHFRQAILAISCASLLSGCGSRTPNAGLGSNIELAIDVSDRNPQRLVAYANAAYRLQRLAGHGSTIRVYEFAHEIEVIYEGPPIKGRNNFNQKVASKLASEGDLMLQPGTRTEVAIDRLVRDASGNQGDHFLIIFTDGGIEDRRSETLDRLRTVLQRAKDSRSVRCLQFAGVNQLWRIQWEEWLKPLGKRGGVRGLDDMDSVLDRRFLESKR